MKKLLIVFLLTVLFTACAAKADAAAEVKPQPPAALIGNYTYYWTGIEVRELPPREISGRIGSVVPATAMPTHPNEANVGSPNAPYIYLDDGVALLLDGQWIFFKPE